MRGGLWPDRQAKMYFGISVIRFHAQVALHPLTLVAGHGGQLPVRDDAGAAYPHRIVHAPVGDGAVAVIRGLEPVVELFGLDSRPLHRCF